MRIAALRVFGIVAVIAATFSSLCRAQGPTSQPISITIRVDESSPIGTIADDFPGFGYETSAVAQPGFFSAKNERMIRLYRNLGPHGLIRIGGNVSDHARFVPDGIAAPKTEREVTIINQANLSDLGDFARATGWHVMWGLNLATGTREEAVEEAMAVDRALGPNLQSFEIGNEVDLMRKYAKDYDAYQAAYADYKSAIRARLPHATFSGPDVAGNFAFVERFAATESTDIALLTHHYYRGGARDPRSTMQRLLWRDDTFDARLEQLRRLCADHHLDYRINETNSFFGGGKPGVSDTFGSALWCLDYLFDLAAHRCQGVNMETDVNQLGFVSFYSPIAHDAAGVCSARPEYYGMLAFAMAGHGELLKTTFDRGDVNLVAYATRVEREALYLTVINKDLTTDVTVKCRLPERGKAAGASRLRGPSIDARSGVTFAGAAVADEGSWEAGAREAMTVVDGAALVVVPHASAVVLKFERK